MKQVFKLDTNMQNDQNEKMIVGLQAAEWSHAQGLTSIISAETMCQGLCNFQRNSFKEIFFSRSWSL